MNTRIERDLRLLKGYALVTSAALTVVGLAAFSRGGGSTQVGDIQGGKAKFTEIDVERINVMEPDGKYRMVIANRPRSQGPLRKGKPFINSSGTRPGIIFYDDEGSENGGLIFGGKLNADGTYSAYGHMSFDQFHQNQVLVLRYNDDNGRRQVGVSVLDRHNDDFYEWTVKRDSIRKLPDSPAKTETLRKMELGSPDDPRVAERVYVGRDYDKNAVVNLKDRFGNLRIRMMVDSLGAARLDFLDPSGRVTYSLPDTTGSRR